MTTGLKSAPSKAPLDDVLIKLYCQRKKNLISTTLSCTSCLLYTSDAADE